MALSRAAKISSTSRLFAKGLISRGPRALLSIANNRMPLGMSPNMNGGRSAIVYQPVYIGSGDAFEMVLSSLNFAPNGETASPFTIDWAIFFKDGAAPSSFAPITFSGNSSKVIAANASDIQADAVPASALGLSKFSRGDLYWVKASVTTASTTATLPRMVPLRNSADGGEYRFDPSVTTPAKDTSNPAGASGLTPAPDNQRFGFVVLGRYLGTPDRVFAGIGDSIPAGFTDGDLSDVPKACFGFFDRAMMSRSAGALSFINMCLSSEMAAHSLQTNLRDAYLKYCTAAVEEYDTNDIGAGPVSAVQGTLQSNNKAIWAKLRNAGIGYIVRSQLLSRTSGTWTDEGGQTILPDWGAGSNADNLNSFFAAQTGVYGGVDAVASMAALRGTSPYKWKAPPTLTADGTHPNSAAHRLMRDALLAVIDGPVTTQVAPGAPVFGTATATATSVTVAFTVPGAVTTQARIFDGATVVQDWATVASPATFSGLTAGTAYTVQARGVNPVNTGAPGSVTATPVATPAWVPTLGAAAASMAADGRTGSQRLYGGSALTDFLTDAGTGGVQTNASGFVTNARNVSFASALAAYMAAGKDFTLMGEVISFPTSPNSQRLFGQYAALMAGFDGSGRPQIRTYDSTAVASAASVSTKGNVQTRVAIAKRGNTLAISVGGGAVATVDITGKSMSVTKLGSENGAASFWGVEIPVIAVWSFGGADADLVTLSGALTP